MKKNAVYMQNSRCRRLSAGSNNMHNTHFIGCSRSNMQHMLEHSHTIVVVMMLCRGCNVRQTRWVTERRADVNVAQFYRRALCVAVRMALMSWQ